ncbi:MAG: hypothetical protein ACHRXM_26405 [Isosphaerales bacterium]
MTTDATPIRTCATCGATLERFQGLFSGQCPTCVDAHADADTDTDDDEPETTTCDFCEAEISQAVYDAGDGLCQTCIATTLVCEECSDRIAKTDAHATHTTLCDGCGDAKAEELATEALDAAKEELQALVDELVGNDDIDAITAAVAALKALTK